MLQLSDRLNMNICILLKIGSNIWVQHPSGAYQLSKEQKSNKEAKKKPALSPKEKKAAKKAKKNS